MRVLAIAILAVASTGTIAWADDSDAYREAYTRGTELFDQGEWAAAREQFQKAYEFQPKPLLLFNIGSTYRRENNYIEALFYYHRYLEEAPADAEYRSFAEKVIIDLNAKIEAEKAAAEASKAQDRTSDNREGSDHDSDKTAPVSGPADAADTSNRGLKYTGLAIVVAGVAGLGWGGYEAWQARRIAGDLGDLPMGTPWTPALQSEYERGEAAETRATIALAAGGAAVVLGGALYLIGRRGSGESGESRGVALGPQLGPHSLGVTVSASF